MSLVVLTLPSYRSNLHSKKAEKGTPTISGKPKIKSKDKVKKHKKHKEKDRDKEKEQKKHKHRHKDRSKDKDKDKEKKKDKSGNHESGGDHSKKHEKVTHLSHLF
jgi:Mg-chelatase subunit ChlI